MDTRLPVTLPILKQVLQASSTLDLSPYSSALFKVMCSTAFFAFLRIGEITTTSTSSSVIQARQLVKLVDEAGNTHGYKLTFINFKHSYNQRPISISLTRRDGTCPVYFLSDYLSRRSQQEGPLFQHIDGKPVTRSFFTTHLSTVFGLCGLDTANYKGHSFRIGAASHAAECGFSDSQIRLMGRWKSDAFKKYIRTPSLTT